MKYHENALQIQKTLSFLWVLQDVTALISDDKPHQDITRSLYYIGACHQSYRKFSEALKYHKNALQKPKSLSDDKTHRNIPHSVVECSERTVCLVLNQFVYVGDFLRDTSLIIWQRAERRKFTPVGEGGSGQQAFLTEAT